MINASFLEGIVVLRDKNGNTTVELELDLEFWEGSWIHPSYRPPPLGEFTAKDQETWRISEELTLDSLYSECSKCLPVLRQNYIPG